MAERGGPASAEEVRAGGPARSFLLRCVAVAIVCAVGGWFDDEILRGIAVAVTTVVAVREWQRGQLVPPLHASQPPIETPIETPIEPSIEPSIEPPKDKRPPPAPVDPADCDTNGGEPVERYGGSGGLVRRFRDEVLVLTVVTEEMAFVSQRQASHRPSQANVDRANQDEGSTLKGHHNG